MKARPHATPLARLALLLGSASAGILCAQPAPPAGAGMNGYPPGAIQPPIYQPVRPTAPTPPPGPPPPGYGNASYRPPTIHTTPGQRPQPMPAKGTAATASKSKGSTKSTSVTKSSYRPSAGGSTAGKSKSPQPSASLESRVGKLESSTHRQDLRLGRLERDVGLLPSSIEGGGMADVVPTGKTHIVRPGDTLFSVASRYSTSVGELRTLNHLTDETLDIGETLLIPDGQTWSAKPTNTTVIHVVSGEESLASIARTYGVTEDSIARANPTAYASDLRNGERLIIPNPKRMPTGNPRGGSSQQSTTTVVTSNSTHVVKKGEMLGRIASKHGITLSKLMSANGIKDANKIVIGQKLLIPGRKTTRTISEKPMIARHEDQDTTPLPNLRFAEAERAPAAPLPPITQPAPPAQPALQPITKPAAAEPMTQRGIVSYRAQRGDTIESVASHFSTTTGNIRAMNPRQADKTLKEGDEIFVPTVGPVSVN